MENLISFCLCQVLFFQKKLSQYETSLRISKMIFICGSYCSDADAVSMHQICLAGDHRFSVLHSIVLTHFLTSRDLFLSHQLCPKSTRSDYLLAWLILRIHVWASRVGRQKIWWIVRLSRGQYLTCEVLEQTYSLMLLYRNDEKTIKCTHCSLPMFEVVYLQRRRQDFFSGGGGTPRPLKGYHAPIAWGPGGEGPPDGSEVSFFSNDAKYQKMNRVFKNLNIFLAQKIYFSKKKFEKLNIFDRNL